MIGQGCGNAEGKSTCRYNIGLIKDDCAVALELELIRKQCSERFDEVRLAVKVHCILGGIGLLSADSHSASTLGLRSEVRWFTPLEGFFQLANTFR